MHDIRTELSKRILILDGAMGTMLQRKGLQGNSESFNLTNPETIGEIHNEYIEAGADIITANSFSANSISQSEYNLSEKAGQMAEAAARIARKAADEAPRKIWVAGSVGPTSKSLSLAQNINDPIFRPYSFDGMAEAFEVQIRGLVKGGVDLLLFETCFDALNTKAALYAIGHIPEASDIPIMISASMSDRSGRTLTGQTMEAFYRSVQHCSPLSFGLNCSLGAEEMIPLIAEVASFATCAVSCYPNAGLPNEMGEYDETPSQMAESVRKMALAGSVNIVGGCCGTTPEHIKAVAEAVKGISPRAIPEPDDVLYVSGLESVAVDRKNNFTNVGERTNVAGSRKFAKLIAAGDYETGLQIAAGQIENGAGIIDINMDDAMLDSRLEMEKFLRYVSNDPAVAKAAIMIDSSHWETLVSGLKNAQGKCIVNSISLKEGEEIFIEKAREIKALGAAIIVIAFDEEGQATTYDRKVEICRRAYSLLTSKVGVRPCDIIFDVNVLPVGTGIPEHSRYGIDFIEAVRWIKGNLPGCRTSGGISNLSFSFRGNNTVREAMHSVFLYHAISAGLDMGIVNPGMLRVYDEIEPGLLKCVEDVILDSDDEATDRLIEKASRILDEKNSVGVSARPEGPEATCAARPIRENGRLAASGGALTGAESSNISSVAEPAEATVEERLVRALVKGDSSGLERDINECLTLYDKPVEIIDGPLMSGMARVGELFGAGKMFLPQVVKSAKTMKNAVALLQPYIEESGGESEVKKPRIVFATVKGDVHDIGKNITEIVLSCNGFEIVDLGVMVPKETILEKAAECSADLIGVSGLITPSLYQMEEICKEMTARGLDTPLLVGGAAASALHTAVRLAPLYGHVFYGQDASASAVLANQLITDREGTEAAEHKKQEHLRELYAQSSQKKAGHKPVEPFPAFSFIKGEPFGNISGKRLGIEEVEPFFDWNMFAAIWGIKSGTGHDELRKLRADAHKEIDRLKDGNACQITISARFDGCHSEGDDIVSKDFRLPMLRQEGERSLADFVPPKEYGFESPMGMFAISVRTESHPSGCDCPACGTEYGPMLTRAVRLTLAEAASEWLSRHIHKELPSEFSGAKVIKPAAGYSSCPDHTLKRNILRLLPESERLGITLLDSCAMIPDASICGLIFIHPDATYPEIRRVSQKAIDEYARRRGMSDSEKARFLGHLL
ncbi:MAG: homocysteine S-methyltransferase family protein [Bacteroidales bacterium]|jgi:5-methyltetrahydrofolate--homocysteine methyltransferase|nr:homocysteine S-methyltransferase family protein [Bacteroidales bacterium]